MTKSIETKESVWEGNNMDSVTGQEKAFSYKYSAAENKEIQEIRKRYLPHNESKLDEIKRLDAKVQNSGVVESLCIGIISSLIFGLGMCLAMQVIGSGMGMIILGVFVGIIGMIGMIVAYPICCKMRRKAKEQYSSRILELTESEMF